MRASPTSTSSAREPRSAALSAAGRRGAGGAPGSEGGGGGERVDPRSRQRVRVLINRGAASDTFECPLYPRERREGGHRWKSEKGQFRKSFLLTDESCWRTEDSLVQPV